ncbi:MAG: mannose-6-phosphate isomerase, partial [Bacteroidales bacterium]|nr:mannose-6-phosphate isomerase [Bacteroidales bacterium]
GDNPEAKVGESWEISSVEGNESVVANGVLKGNTITELIEVYMSELVGEKVYEKHGLELPVLIKIIDAKADLSVQVHPNEKQANEKYNAHGKTEMWYILNTKEQAKIIAGFEKNSSRLEVEKAIADNTVVDLLRKDDAQPGDVFFIPAGRIHAIGSGNVLVEIQQTSDITFRAYDYDRRDDQGNPRQLHVQESLEVLDYNAQENNKTPYIEEVNKPTNLAKCPYFTTNIFNFDKKLGRDYYFLDSYVILICTEGEIDIEHEGGESVNVKLGESILLPASIREYFFNPKTEKATFLETYLEL